MKQQYFKYYIGIVLIFGIDILHVVFSENNDMFDVYLFFDYDRYFTNILSDISNYFRFSVLTYWLISLNRKIFRPLFLMSLFAWISYFIDYSQLSSVFLIPIYIVLIFTHNKNIFK